MLAAADAVVPERTLTLAPGAGVRVRIAGQALAERLAPALAPLTAEAPAAIEITAWEGAPYPPPCDLSEDTFSARDGVAVLRSRDAVRLHDGDRAAFWVRDSELLTRWETAAPLRTLLRWALRGHGLQMVHAAAVVGPRGAALLAGPAGSGKSTTALAASAAGLGYVADDYCAVALGAPPRAHALCAVGKLEEPWPGLRILPGGPTPDGKQIVVPRGLCRSAPLVSLVLPRVSADGPALEPARTAEALSALASSLLLLPGSRQDDLRALGELARALPAHRLATGPDPQAAAALLGEHLA